MVFGLENSFYDLAVENRAMFFLEELSFESTPNFHKLKISNHFFFSNNISQKLVKVTLGTKKV